MKQRLYEVVVSIEEKIKKIFNKNTRRFYVIVGDVDEIVRRLPKKVAGFKEIISIRNLRNEYDEIIDLTK